MVHYKLTYFPLRGTGEIIRQIFVVAGKHYDDVRIPMDQWAAMKNSTQFGQLPILEIDGKPLAQSHAIARYLAREFGLNGKCAWEESQVNAIADQFKDYITEVRPYIVVAGGMVPGDVNQLRTDVFVPAFKKHFGLFEKILADNGSGYFVGNSLTWVDLLIASHVQDVLEKDLAVVEEFKLVLAHRKKVQSIESIKHWIATRPDSPF